MTSIFRIELVSDLKTWSGGNAPSVVPTAILCSFTSWRSPRWVVFLRRDHHPHRRSLPPLPTQEGQPGRQTGGATDSAWASQMSIVGPRSRAKPLCASPAHNAQLCIGEDLKQSNNDTETGLSGLFMFFFGAYPNPLSTVTLLVLTALICILLR